LQNDDTKSLKVNILTKPDEFKNKVLSLKKINAGYHTVSGVDVAKTGTTL